MAENGYSLVKGLRKQGIDAELIINSRDFGMAMPMWEDLSLHQDPYKFNIREALKHYDLPEWIKIWWNHQKLEDYLSLFYMVKPYDLLHLHPQSPIYMQFASKPYIIHEAGWIRALINGTHSAEKLGRRAYARADAIVMTNPDTYELLMKMKYRREVFIPFAIDTEKYRPIKVDKKEDLLFFHPTRQTWEVKGNYLLFYAFAKFIEAGYKAKLRCVRWGFDEEIANAIDLIKKLKIENYVEWVEPYSKPDLIKAYNESDAVFDQFLLGSSGTTGFETMSCGKPLVIYLNDWNQKCFGEMPPVLNAQTVEQIFRAMVTLQSSNLRKKLGEMGREFVIKHLHQDIIASKIIKLYEEVLER